MFSGGSGAYRNTKIAIDWINIIVGVAVVIIATLIFLMGGRADGLIPVVMFLGSGCSGLNAAKMHFKFEKKKGNILAVICILLLAVTIFSAIVLW